jgi:hypothetical protein
LVLKHLAYRNFTSTSINLKLSLSFEVFNNTK